VEQLRDDELQRYGITRGRYEAALARKRERQQAEAREARREELNITVSVGDVFMEVDHVYPDLTVHLVLFHAAIAEGTIQLLEHNDARWITPAEIPDYAFCPADEEILKRIMEDANC